MHGDFPCLITQIELPSTKRFHPVYGPGLRVALSPVSFSSMATMSALCFTALCNTCDVEEAKLAKTLAGI